MGAGGGLGRIDRVKIVEVTQLAIPEVKVIRYARFRDHRGYFTEHYRWSDFDQGEQTPFMRGIRFVQANESFSRAHTVRGLHFQWNPHMGKLVRTIRGHMIDIVLDIRAGSPTFGKVIAYDMPATGDEATSDWIWVPPGFSHGNTFLADTVIEYFCSGKWSPGCEAGISPLAPDLDWSLCDSEPRDQFAEIAATTELMTDKDRNGLTMAAWAQDDRGQHFRYQELT